MPITCYVTLIWIRVLIQMSNKKPRKAHDDNTVFDLEKAKVGDAVEIRWCDVHVYERIEMGEINEFDEPEPTFS